MVVVAGSQREGSARDVGAKGPEGSNRRSGILRKAFFDPPGFWPFTPT